MRNLKLPDPNEAPDGYYAVLKSDFDTAKNFCDFCDQRKQCCDNKTDSPIPKHRCMEDTVITDDGREIYRKDKCSVL